MATKWPEEVPVLEASDFVQGPLQDGNCRCTVAWASEVFTDIYEDERQKLLVHGTLNSTAAELGATRYRSDQDDGESPEFYSDDTNNSLELIARIWNRAMAKLGYVVGNPEAKHLKRKRK